MKETIVVSMSQTIGQVKEADAQQEIERMNKQENTTRWRKDYSDYMDVDDETDENVTNPCKRLGGYVFIVRCGNNVGCPNKEVIRE